MKKLLWVLQHPTPYNIYLLNGLEGGLGLRSSVVYRHEARASHPWRALPERHFEFREAASPGAFDWELLRSCAEERETFVVFAGWRDKTIALPLIARAARHFPFAFWSDTPKPNATLLKALAHAGFVAFAKRATGTLVTGGPAVERYAQLGIPIEKLSSFPFLVDESHFARAQAVRRARAPSAPFVFVLTGRLVDPVKSQSTALRAFASARAQLRSIPLRLHIAGVGPDEDQLRRLSLELGLAESVEFKGWVEYSQVPDLYGHADAFVIPSRRDPFPVVVIEAMAAGLPVLGSSSCGTVRERVVEGETGFIHAAGDSDTLASHMVRLARNRELANTMGDAAARVGQRWNVRVAVDAMKRLLDQADAAGR